MLIFGKIFKQKFNQYEVLGPLIFKSFTPDNHLILV